MADNILSDQRNTKRKENEEAMEKAIAFLKARGVRFYKLDEYTLQFGEYRYWPNKRKLYRENEEHCERDQDLDKIADLLRLSKQSNVVAFLSKPAD
jgi:hypothetical protein